MKNILAKLSLVIFLSSIAISAYSDSTNAKIASILMIDSSDLVYIYPEGGVQNPPACHTGNNGSYYTLKMSRPRFKEYMSALF